MDYPQLTVTERLILANQYRILSNLEEDEKHSFRAEILENGYEVLYHEIFHGMYDPFPREAGREIHEILTMFRMIDNAKGRLTESQKEQVERLNFVGFDHHGEGKEYLFLMFLIEQANLYQELRGRNLEPIGDRLPEYRRLLQAYVDLGMRANYRDLSFEDLLQLQEYV